MSDAQSAQLRDRLQHFVAITGGQDLGICLLLASETDDGHINQTSTTAAGVQAYTKLQCILAADSELPTLPVLLCINAGDIGATVKAHIESLVPYRPDPPLQHPGHLLAGCTIGPPMSTNELNSVASLFGGMGDMSSACVISAEQSSGLMDPTAEDRTSIMRLEALRRQIGGERVSGILEFWTS
ncbi:hypothetical protein BDZ85DRAFT_263586 [Elsinoe ampelina]|uniref:Uncharacterized protein n=1 Tax=Elsinoe ampelina TaxID=302913 RepID=A0A6A6G9N9_9PEZI|nr:hypothetical protein BDZ85DRAFT_263586 [Elsinoe ampelina]